jgi:hypothetical protein
VTWPVYTPHPRCPASPPGYSNILCAGLITPASPVARRRNEGIAIASGERRKSAEELRRAKRRAGMKGKNKISAAHAAVSGKLSRKAFRIIIGDRRMAAIHEAGHIVIAQKFRLPSGNAWIGPTGTADILEERTWIGHVRKGLLFDAKCTKRQSKMVGVAGVVAEHCWQGDVDTDWFEPWYDPNLTSASDWRLIGCPPGNPHEPCLAAVKPAALLLQRDTGPLWPTLLQTARALIVESRLEWRGPSVLGDVRRAAELAA